MRALAPWRPFRELSTLHHDIDDLFTNLFGEEEEWFPVRWRPAIPSVESFIRNEELVVRADLPGIDPKKVELAIEGNHLVMRGERETKEEHKDKEYLRREVMYGKFERMIALPEGVDTATIKATYHDGVLEVTMKAPKAMVAKKVPITVH